MHIDDSLLRLQASLDYRFNNITLLEQALTHRSCRPGDPDGNNERLEFLGDAVLQIVVSDYLYHQYPKLGEGRLTKIRAYLVSQPTLAGHARKLGLEKYMKVGRNEAIRRAYELDSLLCDVYEAVIGAVYLDSDLDTVKPIILEHVTWADKEHLEKQLSIIDAKSTLQERFQQLGRELPTYYLVQEQGPDHAKEFVMEVIFDGKVLGKGVGRSKKEAAQNAAREALANLDNNHDLGQERHS